MVNRQTQLSTGGTVLVRESVLRGSGPQGPQGPRGLDGIALTVQGTRPTFSDIQTMSNTAALGHNHGWIADDTGLLHVWYRTNPEKVNDFTGSWVTAGRIRGNPGYLNSVAARCIEPENDVSTGILPFTPVVLRWDMPYVDVEIVPVIDSGTGLLENQARPIITGLKMWDGSNAVATKNFDRVAPTVPPGNLSLDYPRGSAVFMVNVSVEFVPTVSITPYGWATIKLFWWSDASTRVLIASEKKDLFNVSLSLTLTTFIRGADQGQYELEVETNYPGEINARRWEWMRLGGGPGPQGDQGIPGAPARIHSASPVPDTAALANTNGTPGQYVLVTATGELYGWQEVPEHSNNWEWFSLGVIRGTAGNANSGFNNFDGLVPGLDEAHPETHDGISDSEQPGQQIGATVNQGAPYPATSSEPRLPYFFRVLAQWVETRIVARFASAAERTTKRAAPVPGEVAWIGDGEAATHDRKLTAYTGSLYGWMNMPFVVYSDDAAPVGDTNYPNGTLWIEY